MQPNFSTPKDPEQLQLVNKLNIIFKNIGLDNIKYKSVKDVTPGVANTQKLVKHGLGRVPQIVWPITGNVYIFGLDELYVDVRSTQTSVNFNIAIVG